MHAMLTTFPAWLFEIAGGAITDFEDTCVPKSQREAPFTIAALHQWEMDIDDDRCVDSAEEVSTTPPYETKNLTTCIDSVDRRYPETRPKRGPIP